MFKKATREKLRARLALDGPAGSGKTYTALRFAFALAGKGGRVAVIDTEHRSASKYAGESPDGVPFDFDVCELEHYSPSTYVNVLKEAGKAGYDVVLIDSLSHAWEGAGGALDIVDRKASSAKGGSFAAWRDVTPMHREMVESILACPAHVIATMRTKTAYELEKNEKGKMEVTKLGTKPIQREGVEYEFDVVADLDLEHILTVSKSRCPALDGRKATKPGGSFVQPLIDWLDAGVEPSPELVPAPVADPATQLSQQPQQLPPAKTRRRVQLSGQQSSDPHSQHESEPCGEELAKRLKDAARGAGLPPEKLREIMSRFGANKLADLPYKEAMKLISRLESMAVDVPF